MKNIFFSVLAIVFCLGIAPQSQAQVVINEYSCSNLNQFADNYGKYEDWIELYNTGSSAVNLAGYYLSDDTANTFTWKIPTGITIAANGFLRFWASGRDIVVGTHYHTNFKLTQTKNTKEFVVLSNPSGAIIDFKKLNTETQLGHSVGRTQNGASTWSIFKTPTPNASNNTQTPYSAYAKKPNMSLPAGYYNSAISVSLSTSEPNAEIRYTTDGSVVTASSALYSAPINISTTKVLKAISISTDPSILPSFMEFNTYFINVNHSLVVVSISGTDLANLANGNSSLEPYGTFEYFDLSKQRKAKTYGEFNKHGQDSWANSQRSIDFISRDEMGYNYAIKEKLFNLSDRDKFQRLILRAAGDDNYPADHHAANAGSAHLRDAYVHSLAKIGDLDLDVRISEKAIVYIDGNYWGVYDLRERPDDHDYMDYYYGQDKYHVQCILVWGNTWAEYGGNQALTDWSNLYTYIMNNNMADQQKFDYVNNQLDVASLVDYYIVNSFTVCSDWLNWNTGWWRGLDSTGTHLRWGYLLWDNDATFGHYINYTGIPNTQPNADPCDAEGLSGSSDPEGHMALLAKLRTNPDFNQYYISREIDLWNTVFSCDNMLSQLDSTVAIIDPEMTQHAARWSGTYNEWKSNVLQLRNFISSRCNYLSTGFVNCYSLTGPYDLTINSTPAGGGKVQLNSLNVTQFPWTGSYFGGMQNVLKAQPNTGYVFDEWLANHHTFTPGSTSLNTKITLTSSDTVTATYIYTAVPELLLTDISVNAYPTFFGNEITVDYFIPEQLPVTIKLFSALGKEIPLGITETQIQNTGNYSVKFNLSNTSLTNGMYFLTFTAGQTQKSFKLVYGE